MNALLDLTNEQKSHLLRAMILVPELNKVFIVENPEGAKNRFDYVRKILNQKRASSLMEACQIYYDKVMISAPVEL